MDNERLKKLEQRVDKLIETCHKLKRENTTLKTRQDKLSQENVRMAEKTQLARERIQAMIGRLKTLERSG